MKLKSLLVLTAALSFGVAAAQTDTTAPAAAQAPTLTDVPAGHWAKDAIDKLVARGIILGYPDGTYRGTQNLTRYEAAVIIARLLDQMASGTGPALDNDTLTSLQNAVQELSADLAALGVRVSDLEENAVSKDDFARLEERVTNLEGASGDAQAVADLKSQLDDLSTRVDDLQSNYDQLRADVDDAQSSIDALNDLTVLLNQDILNLQDRVSALEAGQIDRADFDNLVGRVNDIDTRVTKLEGAPVVSLTGAFSSTNGNITVTNGGVNFDIDRLTTGTFLGSSLSNDDVTAVDTKPNDVFSPGLSASFGLGVKNLTTANGNVVINNANLGFSVTNVFSNAGSDNTSVFLTSAALNGTIAQQPFSVLYNYDYSNFKFNEYVFDNESQTDYARRGVVAKFSAPALPLSPDIQIVAGNGTLSENTVNATTNADTSVTNTANPRAYFGVRAAINPFGLGTLGLSYATGSAGTGTVIDNSVTPPTTTASALVARDIFSADYNFTVGPVALDGVYANSIVRPNGFGNGDTAFYTRAKAAFGFLNVVANYRTIDPDFAAGDAGLSQDGLISTGNNNAPFAADQRGFGVGAQGTLSIATIGAYYDTRSNFTGTVTGNQFGVNAGAANVFAGFGLKGFYNQATNGTGHLVDQAPFDTLNGYDTFAPSTSATATYQGTIPAPYRFTSSYGAVLTHDGSQANALIPNLNLTFGYANFYQSGASDFQAYADYTGNFGVVTVKPFARYHTNSGGNNTIINTNGDNTTQVSVSYNTVKVGALVTTAPLTGVFFAPSLDSGVSYRTSTFNDGLGAPTTELFGKIGLVFNQFFADGVTFGVGYSFYGANNVNTGSDAPANGLTVGDSFDAFRADRDRVFTRKPSTSPFQTARTGTDTGTLNGVYAQLNVYGIKASYGVFQFNSSALGSSTGQGFKVGYEVKF